jgi:Flp pilus assembly pilin Flp
MGAIKRLISDERGGFIIEYVPFLSLLTLLLTVATANIGGNLLVLWWDLLRLMY